MNGTSKSLLAVFVANITIQVLCAQTTVLNFDGLTDSTVVTNQFPGLVFSNTVALTAGITLNEFEFPPHSGNTVVADNTGPITILLSTPAKTFAAFFTHKTSITMTAFDASGSMIATVTSAFSNNLALSGVAGSAPNEFLQVSSQAGIAQITIVGDPGGSSFTLDDASISVLFPLTSSLVGYASNLTTIGAKSAINITNNGANGAPLNGPGFGSPAGNICVNVYAFSPDEQLVSCCSCLVTPNGLVSLSVADDLISNTLTGIRPNSVVFRLLATATGSVGGAPVFSGASCNNTAAIAGSSALPAVDGLHAWGTNVHVSPTSGLATTEVPYIRATLSSAEQASLTNRCTNILGNGSTFGICRSCRSGGLGVDRK